MREVDDRRDHLGKPEEGELPGDRREKVPRAIQDWREHHAKHREEQALVGPKDTAVLGEIFLPEYPREPDDCQGCRDGELCDVNVRQGRPAADLDWQDAHGAGMPNPRVQPWRGRNTMEDPAPYWRRRPGEVEVPQSSC